jgi:pimeloyl-ACP methyl ester carboxylesterase
MVTLIPAGVATPRGLGVMIGLHGAGGSAASMATTMAPSLTRARVTALAVVCVDGGETYWHEHADGDDPIGMIVHEVLPRAAAAGMRTARIGVGGESMGGFGALLVAERLARPSPTATSGPPTPAPAMVAALSPAVFATYQDARAANAAAFDSPANFARNNVFSGLDALRHVPAYVACGTDDPFAPQTTLVRARLAALIRRPVPGGIMAGCHDSAFWGRHWPTALELMGARLGGPRSGRSPAA